MSTEMKKNTVVIAMDDSEFSDLAFKFYMESLHRPENHVILTHATKYSDFAGAPVMDVMAVTSAPKVSEHDEKKTQELKAKLLEMMKPYGVEFDVECVHGEYGPSICTVALDNHADYVVVGCRGRGTVSRIIKGSITDYVAHNSSVPVVIARDREVMRRSSKGNPIKRMLSKDKS